jgi:diguanylate cyclase (GGDEF)-like protein
MTLDRRLARDIGPFAATTLLGFALVPVANQIDWMGYAAGATLVCVIGAAVVLAPWRRLPGWTRLAAALLYLASLALLRDASGTPATGVGALTLVPVFWMALYGTRGQLLLVITGVSVFILRPTVLAMGPAYPVATWRTAVIFGAAAAVLGTAVQALVARVRSDARVLAMRERDLEAMADLSRSLSQQTDARERICAAACELSGAQFAVLLEAQPDGTLRTVAQAGTGLALDMARATEAYRSESAGFLAMGPAAVAFEPVLRGEHAVGVLVAGWREQPSDVRRTTGLVRLLAAEAAFVIDRADLLARLTDIALTDDLTGLPNRRAWDRSLEHAIDAGQPVCVALLDLDWFKSYNDDNGHQGGDRLLKEAAAAWRGQLRATDVLARYGGEEFAVLIEGDDLEVAERVVERLRAATPRGQSCSAGLAGREADDDAAALLRRADQALYEAKRGGRDRSVVADAPVG